MKLLLFWIKEMKDVRKHTIIGLRSYLKHKLRITYDDRCFLFGSIDSYRYDYYLWKQDKNNVKFIRR
ncbi:hypothetical protein BK751_00500 [Bacillus thuringiensis serovar galleriae]|nr:hypothetical protein BF15_24710 [Bacillus thuringiensis]OTW47619.1 hypothetical protein BK701_32920 [Bacillus thuringiensis serovar amagiensis]OTY50385.1 hypothetical protein BK747_33410 [Bacillus thuringiensis serovar azorensis]OTY95067.1 hypothetical protein BK751_00500 [Bacillus thuringiensis serovar galleriae]OTZ51557.1 hypothetical protein BK766_21450 [Bacillus thuringiensis serovar wuhanensis]